MKYRILLIVMLSVAFAGFAEPRMLHFGREHGLSNNYIMGIAQDAKGYVWVSTESGLNRFDGSSFRAFRKDSASLSAKNIAELIENSIKQVQSGASLSVDTMEALTHVIAGGQQ